jgi:hypothetical protein
MSERVKFHGWRDVGPMKLEVEGSDMPAHAYVKGPCRVLVSHEPHAGKMRWHLSISCTTRYPDWEEIKDARYALLPVGLTFAQILPPRDQFINIHPNCFHLWELDHHEW